MQCEKCHSGVPRSLSLLADHVKETGGFRAVRLLRAVDTSDQLGLRKYGGEPNAAAVADEAREPAPVRFLTRWLDLGLGVVRSCFESGVRRGCGGWRVGPDGGRAPGVDGLVSSHSYFPGSPRANRRCCPPS